MKVLSIGAVAKAATLALVLIYPVVAAAQGVIQRAAGPYLAQPDIQFAIVVPNAAATPSGSVIAQISGATKVAPAFTFEVVAADRTIREVLQRWARVSGWKHESIHWTLALDFPVQGTASAEYFGGEFREAARKLLSSTETTDLPSQPCFYTNFIVRVVPQAELCDRTASPAQ